MSEIKDSDIPSFVELFKLTENIDIEMDKIKELEKKNPDHEIYQDISDPKEFSIRNRVLHYYLIKQVEKSIEIAKDGLLKYPKSPYLHYFIGRTLADIGKYKEGLDHLIISTKLNPLFADAYNEIAMIYYKLGNYEYSNKMVLMAHNLDPDIKLIWVK
jgi:tetratricopeptide (TPR) repeat protein